MINTHLKLSWAAMREKVVSLSRAEIMVWPRMELLLTCGNALSALSHPKSVW